MPDLNGRDVATGTVTRLEDLELAQIDIFDEAFWRDPFSVYDAARKVHPWLAKYQFGYVALDFATMKAFARDDARFRTPNRDVTRLWNAHGSTFERFNDNMLVAMGGAEHKRLRDLVAPVFTPRSANTHRAFMREVFQEILDLLGDAQECDINDLASQYPITVMCALIGIARADLPKFVQWLDVLEAGAAQDVSALPQLNESLDGMYGYVTGVVDERRKPGNHPKDLVQSLVDIAHEGEKLTDEEVRTMLILLLGGGFDTTKNQLNLIMKIFIDNPDYCKKTADDPQFAKRVIEESLRFMTPLGGMHRVVNEDFVYRDVLIPANAFVTLPITYSGRDPEANPDPNTFNPDREKVSQIAFGQGIHMCLGQFLARALLEEAVPMMARQLRNPRHAGEPVFRSPFGIWGYRSLPIAFDRQKVDA